ncbi:MAG: peptide-methionine (S)-S-oxide reductase MsrA [Actinomycetes bacterium]
MILDRMARRLQVPTADKTLPGRDSPTYAVPKRHAVLDANLEGPWPEGMKRVGFGMGCFWGAERIFWQLDGVHSTVVGYGHGTTPNPTYEEVCSGHTGHNEIVEVVYDPEQITFAQLLKVFWEGHDPTQGMRQGNDLGTQYRSGIYPTTPEQQAEANESMARYSSALDASQLGPITTEIEPFNNFFPAEEYHQQYLHKVPNGYCGLGGTGVSCPIGTGQSLT